MTITLILEQIFNGLQAGVTLFLVAAGLTLILGVMNFVFLAHGAQVMIGAYAAAAITNATGHFYIGILLAIPLTFISGYLLEYLVIRHLYRRDHMEQVLATFGLILFFNEAIRSKVRATTKTVDTIAQDIGKYIIPIIKARTKIEDIFSKNFSIDFLF